MGKNKVLVFFLFSPFRTFFIFHQYYLFEMKLLQYLCVWLTWLIRGEKGDWKLLVNNPGGCSPSEVKTWNKMWASHHSILTLYSTTLLVSQTTETLITLLTEIRFTGGCYKSPKVNVKKLQTYILSQQTDRACRTSNTNPVTRLVWLSFRNIKMRWLIDWCCQTQLVSVLVSVPMTVSATIRLPRTVWTTSGLNQSVW